MLPQKPEGKFISSTVLKRYERASYGSLRNQYMQFWKAQHIDSSSRVKHLILFSFPLLFVFAGFYHERAATHDVWQTCFVK